MQQIPENIIQFKPILNKLNETCRIIIKDKLMGSGFFLKININHNNYNKSINFLLSNNHILKDEFLKLNSEFEIEYLKISQNNKINKITIKIDKTRLFFTNALLDYSCVEIYDYEISGIDFFEIDDNINSNDPFYEYVNQICLIIQYPKGIFGVAKGPIVDINKRNQIFYKISTEYGSSGSPIFLSKNSKIIGIHCGRTKDNIFKKGIFIKPVLENIQIKYNQLFERKCQIEYENNFVDCYFNEQFILNKWNW